MDTQVRYALSSWLELEALSVMFNANPTTSHTGAIGARYGQCSLRKHSRACDTLRTMDRRPDVQERH